MKHLLFLLIGHLFLAPSYGLEIANCKIPFEAVRGASGAAVGTIELPVTTEERCQELSEILKSHAQCGGTHGMAIQTGTYELDSVNQSNMQSLKDKLNTFVLNDRNLETRCSANEPIYFSHEEATHIIRDQDLEFASPFVYQRGGIIREEKIFNLTSGCVGDGNNQFNLVGKMLTLLACDFWEEQHPEEIEIDEISPRLGQIQHLRDRLNHSAQGFYQYSCTNGQNLTDKNIDDFVRVNAYIINQLKQLEESNESNDSIARTVLFNNYPLAERVAGANTQSPVQQINVPPRTSPRVQQQSATSEQSAHSVTVEISYNPLEHYLGDILLSDVRHALARSYSRQEIEGVLNQMIRILWHQTVTDRQRWKQLLADNPSGFVRLFQAEKTKLELAQTRAREVAAIFFSENQNHAAMRRRLAIRYIQTESISSPYFLEELARFRVYAAPRNSIRNQLSTDDLRNNPEQARFLQEKNVELEAVLSENHLTSQYNQADAKVFEAVQNEAIYHPAQDAFYRSFGRQ